MAAAPAIFHFGERQRGLAKAAFRRDPPDKPVGAAAAGAMVDLVLAIDGIVAALGRVVRESTLRVFGPWIASFRRSFPIAETKAGDRDFHEHDPLVMSSCRFRARPGTVLMVNPFVNRLTLR